MVTPSRVPNQQAPSQEASVKRPGVCARHRELELDALGRLRQHAGDVPVWTLPLLDHDVDAPSLQALMEQSLR